MIPGLCIPETFSDCGLIRDYCITTFTFHEVHGILGVPGKWRPYRRESMTQRGLTCLTCTTSIQTPSTSLTLLSHISHFYPRRQRTQTVTYIKRIVKNVTNCSSRREHIQSFAWLAHLDDQRRSATGGGWSFEGCRLWRRTI
jgi:hypothetical protein